MSKWNYVSYWAHECPVHDYGWDHKDRRCSCRFSGEGNADNVQARRHLDESDEAWQRRFDAACELYEKGKISA